MIWRRTSGATMMSSERPNRLRGSARLIRLRRLAAGRSTAKLVRMLGGPGPATPGATRSRSIGLEDIAGASNRLDVAGEFWIVLDLAPQPRHLHVDSAHVAAELRLVCERLARHRLAGAAHQRGQERRLGRCEVDRLLATEQLGALKIEAEGAEAALAAGLRRGREALQDVADTQDELARLEGLGEIVVGAMLEPGDAVLRFGHRGEQEDRRSAGRPQRLRLA